MDRVASTCITVLFFLKITEFIIHNSSFIIRITIMSKVCEICGKHKAFGGHITRRGLAKKKGGIGLHVVKNTKRTFSPNLQIIRALVNGSVVRMKVCTSCIRSNKVAKAGTATRTAQA